ncbi:hypothetical protein K7X08_001170 [Anisodus acutangulus]|uniref:F-box domain-containing protein n=1 Tax=Anisodus acutangulus TaxID=402998 RepID=A0A9Q1RKD0_9SOLA|nr:hypothetical protein K7X08_001170 [Anisodus acutangulus]
MRDETAKIGSCVLPVDVIVEILLRIPVKSLLRFRAVSKPWYGFLSSYDFIQMHKTTPVKADEEIDDGVEVYKIGDFDDADLYSVSVDLPFPSSPDDEVWIVGSCNGLLCIHFNKSSSIILWNPATRKYRFLECPDCVSFYSDPFFPYIMLGFVPETDDYKVVKVPSSSRKDSNAKVWVYILNSDSWEEMGAVLHGLLPKGADLSTIHVTPEDDFSYASLEAVEYYLKWRSLGSLVERVLACIQPDEFSIALHAAVACKLLQVYLLSGC